MDFDAHQQCEFRDEDHNIPGRPSDRHPIHCALCGRKIFLDEASKDRFCFNCGNVLSSYFHYHGVKEVIDRYFALTKDQQGKVANIFGYKLEDIF